MATTNDDTGTPTPAKVKDLATQTVRLPDTALLGIFGPADDPQALIRLPRGKTQTVAVGDSVAGGTVVAIGADQLILSRLGKQTVMALPSG